MVESVRNRKWKGVFVLRITLSFTTNNFKGAVCDIVSPLDVLVLHSMYTKTNRIPAHTQPPTSNQ